jgi:hypothetical protein
LNLDQNINLTSGARNMNMKTKAYFLIISLVLTIGLASAQNCEPQTFSKVTPAVFSSIKSFVEDNGISVPSGDSGELSYMGVSAYFWWDGESSLTVKFTSLPIFISPEKANDKLNSCINQFIP